MSSVGVLCPDVAGIVVALIVDCADGGGDLTLGARIISGVVVVLVSIVGAGVSCVGSSSVCLS